MIDVFMSYLFSVLNNINKLTKQQLCIKIFYLTNNMNKYLNKYFSINDISCSFIKTNQNKIKSI